MPTTITWETLACRERAKELSLQLGLTLAKFSGVQVNDLTPVLHVSRERLMLLSKTDTVLSALYAEFLTGPLGYRFRKGGGRNQPVAKAVGLKSEHKPTTILDATAGLGRDAFVLASLGCKVHLVERSPIMAALLQDGLSRAKREETLGPALALMTLSVADAREILGFLKESETPDVVYLDPMFPARKKSALTKIEMRIIRDMVGEDIDAADLLSLALQKARRRVVVKRWQQAPLLGDREPNFMVQGKSNRFDVYLTKGNNNDL